jgi:hypothetical protein
MLKTLAAIGLGSALLFTPVIASAQTSPPADPTAAPASATMERPAPKHHRHHRAMHHKKMMMHHHHKMMHHKKMMKKMEAPAAEAPK